MQRWRRPRAGCHTVLVLLTRLRKLEVHEQFNSPPVAGPTSVIPGRAMQAGQASAGASFADSGRVSYEARLESSGRSFHRSARRSARFQGSFSGGEPGWQTELEERASTTGCRRWVPCSALPALATSVLRLSRLVRSPARRLRRRRARRRRPGCRGRPVLGCSVRLRSCVRARLTAGARTRGSRKAASPRRQLL